MIENQDIEFKAVLKGRVFKMDLWYGKCQWWNYIYWKR